MAHRLLEVVNVKQGDCFILRPDNGCKFEQQAIIIDTGNGINDYTKRLEKDESFHVLLTHSHVDHVNGFNLLLSNKLKDLKTLLLPYYHNESVLIAYALLRLKGMASLTDSWGLKRQLNQIISNQRLLINLAGNITIRFVHDGYEFCDHMSFLNPPLMWKDFHGSIKGEDLQSIIDLFNEDFANEFRLYLSMSSQNARFPDAPYIYRMMIYEDDSVNDMRNRSNYVLGYLKENLKALQLFNEHPTEKRLLGLIKKKELTEHQACVIMRCFYGNKWFLFGGDADKSVWNRLIRERKDISAYYFKVPHHGSKNNINLRILKKINPAIAIISHDNGLFGKAIDPHPNKEVLDWLNSEKIQLISTNDIIKCGKPTWYCSFNNANDHNVNIINI